MRRCGSIHRDSVNLRDSAASANEPKFKVVAHTQQEEDEYDFVKHRTNVKFTGLIGTIANIVKAALGGGLLSGHVAYMKAGAVAAVPLHIIFGIYMGYCLHLLVSSAQIMYKRTRIPCMSYTDLVEASVMCFPNPKIQRFAKLFRYTMDVLICVDLFGACACYQIIIAKSMKQLVEDTLETSIKGIEVLCIALAMHYAFQNNPKFENLVAVTTLYNQFEFIGMIVFGMSCSGVVIAIENNMRQPHKFPMVLSIGMSIIIICTLSMSFFGYAAYLDECDSPIGVNFPMELGPKILKVTIVLMIYVTFALNFFVPFNLCFHYLKKLHNPEKFYMWELIYRTIFVTVIGIFAAIFPTVDSLSGFLGAFCLTNMAFIWPNTINLLVIWERPGLGKFKWRLWRNFIFIGVGLFILVCGTLVNAVEMVSVWFKEDPTKSYRQALFWSADLGG